MKAIGIDLGTSAVKAVLIDETGALCAEASAGLSISHPHPHWSEQSPADWWTATEAAIAALRAKADFSSVRGIGLAGQMHGAVLLDRAEKVLRPAILWNDGRAAAECALLDPLARRIAGNLAMPGFTAPKLLWVRANEPALFHATARVLLPKDWLRLGMTGEAVSDPSDASGTLWLAVASRSWSEELLAATELSLSFMPRLVEGTASTGALLPAIADAWGLPPGTVVAGGGGDNAAAAVGLGCISPGDAFLSLGTSGVVFVCDDQFRPAPEHGVHAFCHCVPAMWHRMAVILSAASSLSWLVRVSGATGESQLLDELEQAGMMSRHGPVFLPYLAGERTPHNDPAASGVFFGLESGTTRADLTRAVLEGVAFALADGLEALEERAQRVTELSVTGGGARSRLWGRILAAALGRRLLYHAGGEIRPALGAARLGLIAAGGGTLAEVCKRLPVIGAEAPDPALADTLRGRRAIFRRLYPTLKAVFAAGTSL